MSCTVLADPSAGQLGVLDVICRIFTNIKISTRASDGFGRSSETDFGYLVFGNVFGGQEFKGVQFDIWGGPPPGLTTRLGVLTDHGSMR